MASAPGMGPGQMNQAQIQQLLAMEAQKRGMTVPQFQAFQKQQIEQEAAKMGVSPQEFIARKQQEAKEQWMRQQQAQQQQQQQQQGQGQGKPPGQPGPPGQQVQHVNLNQGVEAKPEALAVAKFLRSQNLKCRTCIFDGQRKDMFKVKRAFRALQSAAYSKARTKNPILPAVTNETEAKSALQQLPLSMLALRVVKKDPHEGHNHPPGQKHKKEKRVKGLWDVKIVQQQEFDPMMHYVWLYEGSQWKTKIWAGLALIAVFTVVMFPLWPLFMRQGVYYLSVGAMGLLIAFFGLAIVRLILYCVTYFAVAPGLWIFPNLFEDVGVIDSFKPLYGWQETKKGKKKKAKAGPGTGQERNPMDGQAAPTASIDGANAPTVNGGAVASGTDGTVALSNGVSKRFAATVEDEDD